jgi:hypothetical protein
MKIKISAFDEFLLAPGPWNSMVLGFSCLSHRALILPYSFSRSFPSATKLSMIASHGRPICPFSIHGWK